MRNVGHKREIMWGYLESKASMQGQKLKILQLPLWAIVLQRGLSHEVVEISSVLGSYFGQHSYQTVYT